MFYLKKKETIICENLCLFEIQANWKNLADDIMHCFP